MSRLTDLQTKHDTYHAKAPDATGKLDPRPWIRQGYADVGYRMTHEVGKNKAAVGIRGIVFAPREGYSHNRKEYDDSLIGNVVT